MKKMLFLSFAIWIVCVAVAFAQSQDDNDSGKGKRVVLVNLTKPIAVSKAKQSEARFSELTKEAMEYGLGDVTINGSVEYKAMPDKSIRSQIQWHSLSMQTGDKTVVEGLSSPLQSKVRTAAEERIETGTELKAVGDLDQLTQALMKLKEKADKKTAVVKTDEKVEKNTLAPTTIPTSNDSSYKYDDTGSGTFKTVVETPPKKTQESALCDDVLVSADDLKAFKTFKTIYYEDGKKISESSCSASTEFYQIQSKAGDCSYRFDMTNATAIQQEQLYYMNGAKEVLIGTCRDSENIFPLTETRESCTPIIDIANSKVFPQSRLAFIVSAGTVQYATECRPIDGDPLPLVEEYCEPKFENDFTNGVSYLSSRLYYTDQSEKKYVNTCSRSTNFSWPHLHDTSSCSWAHDDEHLVSVQNANTYINTGENMFGKVEIEPCHEINRVAYSFVGTEKKVKKIGPGAGTWTVPAGVTSVNFVVAAGGGNGSVGNMSCGLSGSGNFSCSTETPCNMTSYGCTSRGGGVGGKKGQAIAKYNYPVTTGTKFQYNVGNSHEATSLIISNSDGAKIDEYNMATSSDENPVPPKYVCDGSYVASKFIRACNSGGDGQDGLVVIGHFNLAMIEDNPKATDPVTNPRQNCGAYVVDNCSLCWQAGKSGVGFGAGGGGAASGAYLAQFINAPGGLPGLGTPGAFWIEYDAPKYMRADGTFYMPTEQPQN